MNTGQKIAYDMILSGANVFVTGPGGTGKSYLLEKVYEDYTLHSGKRMMITAMTGCAALLLGNKATTLHSWAGIGLGKDPINVLIAQIKRSPKALKRWLGTDCLVIDEISMMAPEFLEQLSEIGKKIRKDDSPFGGIQLVAVGDFYQLPPVYKTTDIRFVFESPLWSKMITKTCTLTENMRQQNPVFQKILNEARVGELTEESVKLLEERKGLPWKKLQIRPTLLFSRKYDVDHVNITNLKRLVGPFHRFIAKTVFLPIASVKGFKDDSPEIQASIKKIDKDATYSTELLLAVGAQVILLYNMDQEAGLVNGSRGVVIGFVEKDGVELPKVKFLQGSEIVIEHHTWECEGFEGVMRRQIPLTLGYAITIHKAQGATLDSALIDIGPTTFECGQAYVALSRAKSLESLYIWELDITAFKVHPRVRKFYQELEQQ